MAKIHVAHILCQQQYEAEDCLRKIKEGGDFAVLAAKFSQCPSRAKGGDLGPIAQERLNSDFVDGAIPLKVGEVSGVIKTRFGYHLIKKLA